MQRLTAARAPATVIGFGTPAVPIARRRSQPLGVFLH